MICKILKNVKFYSEFPNISKKLRRRRRWKKPANAKRFVFQASANIKPFRRHLYIPKTNFTLIL